MDTGATKLEDLDGQSVTIGGCPVDMPVLRDAQALEGTLNCPDLPPGPHDVQVRIGRESGVLEAGYTVLDPRGVMPCVPVGHDEDADSIDDACDNCPGIANVDQLDIKEVNSGATADGIGDACDPRPYTGGDELVLFESFERTGFDPSWKVLGDPGDCLWRFDAGSLYQDGPSANNCSIVFPLALLDLGVELAGAYVSFGSTTGARNLAVGARVTTINTVDTTKYSCSARSADDVNWHASVNLSQSGAGGSLATAGTTPLALGQRLLMRGSVAGTSLQCAVHAAQPMQLVGSVAIDDTTLATGDGALVETLRIRGRFDHVAFYALGH